MAFHILAAAAAAIAVGLRSYAPEPRERAGFIGASPRTLPMHAAPIEPGWVLLGSPQARVGSHSVADDESATTDIWDCTAGTFRWFFAWDETVVILEGGVHVTADDGTTRVLRSGDVGYFRAGTWATWRIDDYVRKVAFVRRPLPAPIALVYMIASALRSRLRDLVRR